MFQIVTKGKPFLFVDEIFFLKISPAFAIMKQKHKLPGEIHELRAFRPKICQGILNCQKMLQSLFTSKKDTIKL